MRALAVQIRPGACSWYQGAVSVERRTAHLWEGRVLVRRWLGGGAEPEAEAEEGACHHGVEEEFVETHMCFLGAYSANQFNCLLGREGIHLGGFLQRNKLRFWGETFEVVDFGVPLWNELGRPVLETRSLDGILKYREGK
jgi:hypothetical protein